MAFRTQLFVESHATAVGATGYADEDRDPVVGFEPESSAAFLLGVIVGARGRDYLMVPAVAASPSSPTSGLTPICLS